jgi:hypothetical protein
MLPAAGKVKEGKIRNRARSASVHWRRNLWPPDGSVRNAFGANKREPLSTRENESKRGGNDDSLCMFKRLMQKGKTVGDGASKSLLQLISRELNLF